MEIPDSIVSAAAVLDRASFLKTRDKWIRPSFDLTGLKYLREKAGRKRDIRELYRGRAPYELLQNADDVKTTHAVFVLVNDGLSFLHDGSWFSVANFRSLADGWSDKDPNQCIGHKGLGFRSVLDLTPSPAVVKVDKNWFGFKFGWSQNRGHIDETLHRITVHGDFYVRPDRTRLMPGRYNEWLMEVAGRLFAGEFLTQLLERYEGREVFESLRPSLSGHDFAKTFRTTVQELVRKRTGTTCVTKARAGCWPTGWISASFS